MKKREVDDMNVVYPKRKANNNVNLIAVSWTRGLRLDDDDDYDGGKLVRGFYLQKMLINLHLMWHVALHVKPFTWNRGEVADVCVGIK